MRQVRTCDFCGDEAAGLYEPLPPSIPDAPRMLHCDACRDRLATVVDPLLARLEGGSVSASPVSTGSSSSGTPGAERGGRSTVDPAAGGREGTEIAADAIDAGPEAESAALASSSADDADEADEPAESNEGGPVGESRDASGRAKRQRAGTPHGYRKVMRFLENREFPIDRSEAERLAGEAYDLSEGAVTEAIDHAVQYGRLREVDGQLKR